MDGNTNPQPQMTFTADDLVGILIHNANTLASHLSVNGWGNANWAEVDAHLDRMTTLARQARVMVEHARQAASEHAAVQPN